MQEYPVRAIVSEPFVNQIDVIEKTLIEVRNQPSSYYGRRNNRLQASQQNPANSQVLAGQINQPALQYYKYGNYYQQQHQQQQQQQPVNPDYYGYRQNVMGREFKGGNNNVAGLGGNSNPVLTSASAGSNFGSAHSNESSGSVNLDSAMSSVGSLGMSAPPHVPQVFDDKLAAPESRGLATFDPFEAKDYTRGGMFQPMFNSSNTILGSGYSGSPNIWGDTNKTMTSDAAVWG